MSDVQWRRVNGEPFEYAIQQGRHGDEFVKLIDGSCLRRDLGNRHYEGLSELQNTTLHIAAFLDATAKRVEEGGAMTEDELRNRMRDCATVLRESEAKATDLYYSRADE